MKEYGPVRRIVTLQCTIATAFFASAMWMQGQQAGIATLAISAILSSVCSMPVQKGIKYMFIEVSGIADGVEGAPAHIQVEPRLSTSTPLPTLTP